MPGIDLAHDLLKCFLNCAAGREASTVNSTPLDVDYQSQNYFGLFLQSSFQRPVLIELGLLSRRMDV